ncbi:ferric reductase-like transmembrane domain-containing protein [Motilimonas pumila]|uniref:FAD-binding FR-type domain-containing protein n=1 Tax=Motilimonas pumila TaxID=2303987 RepID=A0A418YB37_9GAMM|nr:ferric reductase-like transmembrane domain-containing protein [Motilimonas pumila]RJG40188.1 hypothetical protein D1Z90_16740 [Motilimonas pumila]
MRWIQTLNIFSLVWLLCLIAGLTYQAYLGWYYESNETTNIYLQLGRVAAYCLLVLMALFWLPVMRNSLTWLSQFKISQLLPIRRVKSLHKWLGHLLMIFALLHGSQYLLYFDTLEEDFVPVLVGSEPDLVRSMKTTMYEFVSEDESIDLVAQWIAQGRSRSLYETDIAPLMTEDCTKCHSKDSTMTYAINDLPLQTYDEVVSLSYSGWLSRQFRINMSGLLMFALFSLIWFTSLMWFRRKNYRAFRHIHRLGYLIAILSLLHVPRLEWLLAPCLVLFAELTINRSLRRYRQVACEVDQSLPGFVLLHLALPPHINNQAGHYVQLKSRQLVDQDWHDFSLTGMTDPQGRAIIKVQRVGRWTNELAQHGELMMDVRGAWASPMAYAKHKQHWLLVAGGIGITPIISLLYAWLAGTKQPQKITLIWVLREAKLLAWIEPMLCKLMQRFGTQITVECYLTSSQAYPAWLQTLAQESKWQDHILLSHGRPDFDAVCTRQGFVRKPTIFTCGPEPMMAAAKKAGKRQGWKTICEQF